MTHFKIELEWSSLPFWQIDARNVKLIEHVRLTKQYHVFIDWSIFERFDILRLISDEAEKYIYYLYTKTTILIEGASSSYREIAYSYEWTTDISWVR